MSKRNLNPYAYFEGRSARHQPSHAFAGTSEQDFQSWKPDTLERVLATMGKLPERVAPNAQLVHEWQVDNTIRQRWLIDLQPNLSASLLIYRPAGLKSGEKRPAILACHGHGAFGKDSPMGLDTTTERAENIAYHNYDYGRRMAELGFVTYAIDFLGFGERSYAAKPHVDGHVSHGRDPCNILYLCATMLGSTVMASNTHDASRATDFVCEQPYVDADNLGVMGLSFGGTMTTWMALTDERFKAADIICYGGPFHAMAYETYNCCGSQITPGLYDMVDMADLQGLIAPRPLLFEAGIHDSCFEIDPVKLGHIPQLEKIYKAAGAADDLWLDIFPSEHAWGANKSNDFFRKYLQAAW